MLLFIEVWPDYLWFLISALSISTFVVMAMYPQGHSMSSSSCFVTSSQVSAHSICTALKSHYNNNNKPCRD